MQRGDLKPQRTEQCILLVAIAVPILLGAWPYFDSAIIREEAYYRRLSVILFLLLRWAGYIVSILLVIWLAWRQPALGENKRKGILIFLTAVISLLLIDNSPYFYAGTGWWYPQRIAGRFLPLFGQVIVMHVVRKLIGGELVRVEMCPRPRRSLLSIKDILIWTMSIAAYTAMTTKSYDHSEHLFPGEPAIPLWGMFYGMLVQCTSWTPLLLLILWCQSMCRTALWLPLAYVFAVASHFAKHEIDCYLVRSMYGEAYPTDPMTLLVEAMWTVLMISLSIWIFRRLGLRFISRFSPTA